MSIFSNIFGKVFKSRNDRLLKKYYKIVEAVNYLEPEWKSLSDSDLQAKTHEFKKRIAANEKAESFIPQAFATVREASRRVLNMRHFDVQLVGGLALNDGKISEMRTGEGKTLVATLPTYLNALSDKGSHIVTVNDYLAERDTAWMRPVYGFLGLTTGVIKAGLTSFERRRAYAKDVTYGTNNEFGFDYLRDNMTLDVSEQVQRGLHYALVDEVDSILIDEARTPLIISGASEENLESYSLINQVIPFLKRGEDADFTVDEKKREVYLTERGHERLERQLVLVGLLEEDENLYSEENINLMYHVAAGLRAHHIFKRDVDYIVKASQIEIVDEHTGRLMPGRRWGHGLHQAIEAKEKVSIQPESQTVASITFQNYFRLYSKLAGMTGTADTEAYEFQQIYGLEVVVIPTNQMARRKDLADKIYLSLEEKWSALADEIEAYYKRKVPVLVGTTSIENSELLSHLLQKRGISHQVLNAKRHEQEASIIAEAGRPGAVTIATNIAGRGTDILLGGNLKAEVAALESEDTAAIENCRTAWKTRNEEVLALGGLHIFLSERGESRRIDNQFLGRCGRQGDPGVTQCYLSLEDDLLRIFGGDRLGILMQRLGVETGEAIEHPWITRAIQNAQRKVEAHHFDVRKQLLEYDDVMNEQRKIIYQQRQEMLETDIVSDTIQVFWKDVLEGVVMQHIPFNMPKEHWNIEALSKTLEKDFGLSLPISDWLANEKESQLIFDQVLHSGLQQYHAKQTQLSTEKVQQLEKAAMLQTMDHLWKEQLTVMEHLRDGVQLRGYAQQNPKQEYKREAFSLFEKLLETLKYQVISTLSRFDIAAFAEAAPPSEELQLDSGYQMIGRNQLCPCDSGKKFKHCHGSLN